MQPDNTLELTTDSEAQTKELAVRLAPALAAGDLISLTGDLGAGKTRFVQGLAAGLGVVGPVNSPTFTIIKLYSGRLPLYHFDVYRLTAPSELESLGFEEYFYGDGVTVVEWGDKVRDLLPPDHLRIEIHRTLDDISRRLFFVQASGPRSGRLLKTLAEAA
jgi:tRNA threonylcarbamoyladenosine biosynthesis protein TsaE